MEVYIKETLHVLDYQDNVVGTIFNSEDHRTEGYAFNISITEANTGYSDLKFDMPNMVLNDKGDQIKNPIQKLLTPLVKLRYRREVYYIGEKPINVREPQGYGDEVVYINKVYSNTYPDNLIEDYIMDYIVQPVDNKRDVLKTTTTYTAMDYPRFNLSKKRVGLTITDETLTKQEWSLFKNKPMDKPGTIKYIQWNTDLNQSAGNPNIPLVWDPEHAIEYPLVKEDIVKLMAHTADWPYGLLATAFYWPITSTARFKGQLYKEGGYLVLQLYDFFNLTTEGIDPELYIDRYSWEWTQLYQVQSYLCPNNGLNYLYHILEGTNWTVALRPNGTPDVDIVKTTIPNPKGSTEPTEEVDLTSSINVTNGNCYNAITATCQALQLYPVFDCINRTVALRQFAGKNYGLTYALGKNLKDNSTKADGEKVITKLYCSGGKDYNGDADINIGTAERSYLKVWNGIYRSIDDAPTTEVEGYWAIVDPDLPAANFNTTIYKLEEENNRAVLKPYTVETHDDRVKNYWVAGENRQVYFWDGAQWVLGEKLPTGNWQGTVAGQTVIVDPTTGDSGIWSPNEDMYINSRSPYGTNYILNLRWAYQNNWITKEQILELYQYEKQINDLNESFMNKYIEDYNNTRKLYNEAVNNYDIAQDGYESTLYAMENKYYNVDGEYSEGTTYCFHKAPKGTYEKDGKDYIKLFHCYGCELTRAVENNKLIDPTGKGNDYNYNTTCPVCGSTDTETNEIYVPVYDDFTFEYKETDYPYGTDVTRQYEGHRYNPHLKGYFQRLVMSLDRASAEWSIEDYEQKVSMIKGIPMEDRTVTLSDGYIYKLEGVYVRSTSGQIEVWNNAVLNYIKNYGDMLSYLRIVNEMIARIEQLEVVYDQWKALVDGLHATIQEKFGDYLIEGNYTNKEQPYINLLFKEGMEASDKYSIPEVTYSLNVIDSSGLIEYREPTVTTYHCVECGYSTHDVTTACPRCGNENIEIQKDTYNDLVKMLHSVGQIIPKAGDYVAIYDEPMGMFGVPGLITQITRCLDNPINNRIELNTSYTDDEELVGNIITATNTVLNNTDIYARTAVLKSDGTLDENSIRESIDNVNANISIVGTNGNVLLDGSGLRATDPMDPQRAMKYAGNGIFNTTNLDNPLGDPVIWEKMMSPSGINATYINSGTIDTNKLTIMSGLSNKVVLDQYGLSVKNNANKTSHVTRFNKDSAKTNANYVKQWGIDNNLTSFIGVDPDNNGLIYTKGFLAAEEGSNIANWITSNDGFYHLDNEQKDLWLSPGGISGTVYGNTDNMLLYAKGKFGVGSDGTLYASNAKFSGSGEFSGKITVTDTSSQMNKGTVGGWTAGNNGLTNGTLVLSPAGGAITGTVHDSGSRSDWGIYMNGNFGVTTNGDLYASNAHIKGDIYADSGTFNGTIYANAGQIGGWTINSNSLSGSGKISGGSISGSSISGGSININNNFKVGTSGKLTATGATLSGSFSCDGWILNGNRLAATNDGDVYIQSDGTVFLGMSNSGHSLHVSSVAAGLETDGTVNVWGKQAARLGSKGEVWIGGDNIQLDGDSIYVQDSIAGGLISGVSPGWFKCESPTGTPELYIVNGLVCGYRVS